MSTYTENIPLYLRSIDHPGYILLPSVLRLALTGLSVVSPPIRAPTWKRAVSGLLHTRTWTWRDTADQKARRTQTDSVSLCLSVCLCDVTLSSPCLSVGLSLLLQSAPVTHRRGRYVDTCCLRTHRNRFHAEVKRRKGSGRRTGQTSLANETRKHRCSGCP